MESIKTSPSAKLQLATGPGSTLELDDELTSDEPVDETSAELAEDTAEALLDDLGAEPPVEPPPPQPVKISPANASVSTKSLFIVLSFNSYRRR